MEIVYRQPELLTLFTEQNLLRDSTLYQVNPGTVTKSLNYWSNERPKQLKRYINTTISPCWNDVEKDPVAVQDCLKKSLEEYRRTELQWKVPMQKVTPSFAEVLQAAVNKKSAGKSPLDAFIKIGIEIQSLVNQLIEMDQCFGNFMCFGPTRKKYINKLNEIKALTLESACNKEIHKSFKKARLERGYALLFSVVPKVLEIIEIVVKQISSEISNAKITEKEVNEWSKEARKRPISSHMPTQFQIKFDGRIEKIDNSESKNQEILRLKSLLEEKTKEIDELRIEIDELRIENDELRTESKDCGSKTLDMNSKIDIKHLESQNILDDNEFDRWLKDCRQEAQKNEKRLETNYSSSNFAYGVFDNRGGNLSVGNGNAKLFIPEGAIATTQEIYIYVDPKARFSGNSKERAETRVAPIVHCGPPGTTFLTHVFLTIPHNADDEQKWRFTPLRSEGGRHTDDWQDIEDDSMVIVDNGVCIFMVKHFTRFTVTQKNVPA